MLQPEHCRNVGNLNHKHVSLENFVFERARGSCIADHCKPETAFTLIASQNVQFFTSEDVKCSNALIVSLRENVHYFLCCVQLKMLSLRLRVFVNCTFLFRPDLTPHIWLLIFSKGGDYKKCIVRYGSTKSWCITKPLLAAELLSFVYGFDIAIILCIKLNYIHGVVISCKYSRIHAVSMAVQQRSEWIQKKIDGRFWNASTELKNRREIIDII